MPPYPFFEVTPLGAAPGPPFIIGGRVRRFWGCNNSQRQATSLAQRGPLPPATHLYAKAERAGCRRPQELSEPPPLPSRTRLVTRDEHGAASALWALALVRAHRAATRTQPAPSHGPALCEDFSGDPVDEDAHGAKLEKGADLPTRAKACFQVSKWLSRCVDAQQLEQSKDFNVPWRGTT